MDIYDKFKIIENHFMMLDQQTKKQHGRLHFDTQHGIWGPSSMLDCFEFFMKIKLDERKHFLDFGSGDGRIVLIASLFTKATGVEADTTLTVNAEHSKEELKKILPELARCTFTTADYTTMDLSGFDTFFIFADHFWDKAFEKKLQAAKGMLYSYHNIFPPSILKKGKTVWIQQIPLVGYELPQ